MANWKINAGDTAPKTWCAPSTVKNVWARTGCNAQGQCAAGDCGGFQCTTGPQPVSAAEFTLDVGSPHNHYDVTYIDAYNFPITVKPGDSSCAASGCSTPLPACPWPARSGICLGPCKEFTARHLANFGYLNYQTFYILCSACAESKPGVCGCGDQCKAAGFSACPLTFQVSGKTITSCGCSPYGSYPGDQLAVTEVNGSPLTSAQEKPHIYPSNPVCNWTAPSDDPDPATDWTAFPRRVKDSCKECTPGSTTTQRASRRVTIRYPDPWVSLLPSGRHPD